jgi:hypothetical protein
MTPFTTPVIPADRRESRDRAPEEAPTPLAVPDLRSGTVAPRLVRDDTFHNSRHPGRACECRDRRPKEACRYFFARISFALAAASFSVGSISPSPR